MDRLRRLEANSRVDVPLVEWKTCYIMTKRKPPQPKNLTDTLRDCINSSELPFLQLEAQTGVLRQSLMKFARSEQSLRLDQADKLAAFFGLQLTERKKAD